MVKEGTAIDITITKEKVKFNQGGPRCIKAFPVVVSEIAAESAYWQPVINEFLADWQAGLPRLRAVQARGYTEYLGQVKVMLESHVPSVKDVNGRIRKGVGTHCARRSGASLHLMENWKGKTIRYVGGWADPQEFEKYLQDITSVSSVQEVGGW